MNAPNKVYMSPSEIFYKGDRQQESDVEYIRFDAFIEKASEWMKQNVVDYLSDTGVGIVFDEWNGIEEFKKAMKL